MFIFLKKIFKLVVKKRRRIIQKIKKLELMEKLCGAVVFILEFLFDKLNLFVIFLNKILFWIIEDKNLTIMISLFSYIIVIKCVYLAGWTFFLFVLFICNTLIFIYYKNFSKLWIISLFIFVILYIYVY